MSRKTLCALAALAMFGCAGSLLATSAAAPKQGKFDARHELTVKVPDGAKSVRVWFALPQKDGASTISDLKIECTPELPTKTEKDSEGNEILYVELTNPTVKELKIVETFKITRSEVLSGVDASKAKPLTDDEKKTMAKYLAPNTHVVIDDGIKKLAAEITKGEQNTVKAARLIYDWVLENIEYWVKDPNNKKASPVGSSEYCLTSKTGNCTDFHSLWTALARAHGIPTRMVYGSFFKAELDGKDTDQSYHCWPEFYVSGIGWVPHDVAVADIFVGDFKLDKDNEEKVRRTTADGYTQGEPAKVNYYFGNIDERRVVWSVGRDLTLSPKQAGGPVNAMAKAYIEVEGKAHPEKEGWTRKLTFKEIK